MNYKEILNKGLKRGYEFTVAADVYNKSLDAKIEEIKKTIKVDGFRPGKVPNNIIMQKHGEAINAEVLNAVVNENVSKIIQENKHRPVSQPKVDFKNEKDNKPNEDKVFKIEFELFPEIEIAKFDKIEIESTSVKLDKKEIDKRIEMIAKSQRTYKEKPDDYKSKKMTLFYLITKAQLMEKILTVARQRTKQ